MALDADRDWALDLDEVAAAIRPNTRVVSVNFPNNPTGKVIDAADFRALARAVRRARHPPVQRRGLPRPGTRPGPHPAAGRRSVRARAVAERDLEVAGAARAAHRLDHLPRPRAALPPGARQALHHHLQLRAQRGPGPHRPKARETILDRNRALDRRQPAGVRGVLRRVRGRTSTWQRAGRRMRRLPPLPRRRRRGGVLRPPGGGGRRPAAAREHLPLRTHRHPADRFRIGIGRRDPEEGLAAFADWMRARR